MSAGWFGQPKLDPDYSPFHSPDGRALGYHATQFELYAEKHHISLYPDQKEDDEDVTKRVKVRAHKRRKGKKGGLLKRLLG